jgi:hypothetical protein
MVVYPRPEGEADEAKVSAAFELMLYLERAASALDVLSISGDADRPFAIDVGCE